MTACTNIARIYGWVAEAPTLALLYQVHRTYIKYNDSISLAENNALEEFFFSRAEAFRGRKKLIEAWETSPHYAFLKDHGAIPYIRPPIAVPIGGDMPC